MSCWTDIMVAERGFALSESLWMISDGNHMADRLVDVLLY